MQKSLITIEKCRIENNRATLVPELSWEMKEGEVWLVTGPNGSGKADFLNAISGIGGLKLVPNPGKNGETPLYSNIFSDSTELVSLERAARLFQEERENDESDYMAAIAKISSCRTNTNISEELRNEINDLLMESVPTYDNEVIYSDSYFAIHYEANTLSMSTIYTVASYLNFAKATLCFTFEFETPSFEPNKDKYQVYLIPEGDFSGRAVPSIDVSGVSSYIEIVLPDDDALTNYKKGTIVHEFMHAVQFMYLSDNYYDSEWRAFNEATANSLKARLISNPNLKFYVDQFQNSPNYSLFTAYPPANQPDREYGAVLFPLYIEQTYSDFNTIRSVYETFSEDEDSVYETIDNTLQTDEISSLRDAYTEFAYYNYNIQYFVITSGAL